jgi:hypothetical protein
MPGNRGNHVERELFPGEHSQDLRLGELGVVEDDADDLLVTLGEQRAGDARGSAPRECEFLPERKLGKPCDKLILGVALQFPGRAGQERELHQVHQIKLAEETQAGEVRGVGMKGEGALDTIVFEKGLAARNLFEDFSRKVFALEKQAQLCFIECGIVEEGEQNVGGGMVQESREFIAGGSARKLTVVVRARHASSRQTRQRR